jgi:galactokinase
LSVTTKATNHRPPKDFGSRVFRAPGRVNLIGEHTDYNEGFVMPVALDLATWVTVSPNDKRSLVIYSEEFQEQIEFDLDDPAPRPDGHWSDYVRGVAVVLESAGHRLQGGELSIRSEVPLGSGLSSSASLEVAAGYALLRCSGLEVDRVELARLCQRAEHEFVGTRCGIMDQFIACQGQEGQALLLDCRSLDYELLPLPEGVRLVICNTMVKHELAASEYNRRRAECEMGVSQLAQRLPGVLALRDVSESGLELHRADLNENVYRRCRHVVSENGRVLQARKALQRNDLVEFGHLMNESHRSLKEDFEVSCPELDLMVEFAREAPGVFGTRMTGGGFGGCTVSLVETVECKTFQEAIVREYRNATGKTPAVYVCSAAAGVSEVKPD